MSMKVKIWEIGGRDAQELVSLIRNSDLLKGAKGNGKGKKITASASDVSAFAKKNKLAIEDVNDCIWKMNQNIGVEKRITKFVEAIWRFVFYSIFVWFGMKSLFFPNTAEWVLNSEKNWEGWPLYGGPCPDAIKLYYQVELGSYIHQLMWTEVTRSDALEMIIHHVATISLIFLSWLSCFYRIGSTILLTHDVADIFMEAAKCFNYASKAKGQKWASTICDTLFGIFTIVFFVTRLVLYPRYMVYSLLVEAPTTFGGSWPGYWVFGGLLCTLVCLHVFWFVLICRMIRKLMTTGIEKDERSDDEEEDDDNEPPSQAKKKK